MIKTFEIYPGITLRCFPDNRFKQSRLSIQLVRPMCREENALNALLPAVLLRGTQRYPDLQAITRKQDDLYGAGVGMLVRRVGDYQTTGLTCAFSLSNTNYHRFQVLCSFEVATFFINK